MPLSEIQVWLQREQELGSPSPQHMVLAAATSQGVPHSRIVAIREISSVDILFFTQHGTRKFNKLIANLIGNPCPLIANYVFQLTHHCQGKSLTLLTI